MKKWMIFVPYLIGWILTEVLAVIIYFTAPNDNIEFLIGVNVILVPFFLFKYFFGLHSKCPICGKRHLRKIERCSGDRYTLYDAYCPVHNKWIQITWDRDTWKQTYLIKNDNEMWYTKEITPIWEKMNNKD